MLIGLFILILYFDYWGEYLLIEIEFVFVNVFFFLLLLNRCVFFFFFKEYLVVL